MDDTANRARTVFGNGEGLVYRIGDEGTGIAGLKRGGLGTMRNRPQRRTRGVGLPAEGSAKAGGKLSAQRSGGSGAGTGAPHAGAVGASQRVTRPEVDGARSAEMVTPQAWPWSEAEGCPQRGPTKWREEHNAGRRRPCRRSRPRPRLVTAQSAARVAGRVRGHCERRASTDPAAGSTVDTLRQWTPLFATRMFSFKHARAELLRVIAADHTSYRPHHSEPRARKRRPKPYHLRTKPRRQNEGIRFHASEVTPLNLVPFKHDPFGSACPL